MRLSPLTIALSLSFLACSGTLEERGLQASGAGADAAADGDCEPAVAPAPGGHHNPGTACQQCHASGGTGPTFTLGGTIFDGLASTTPVAGATILVTDDAGLQLELVTADNGNFWTDESLLYPITVSASRCPDTIPMVAPVQASGADCNAGGCHGDTFRVYLP